MCDQHEKMKSGVKVCAAPYKIDAKNFYFRPGHSAPPRNFCRALSEIQERRLERLERLRDETRAPGILPPLCLVSTDGPWVVFHWDSIQNHRSIENNDTFLENPWKFSEILENSWNSWISEFFHKKSRKSKILTQDFTIGTLSEQIATVFSTLCTFETWKSSYVGGITTSPAKSLAGMSDPCRNRLDCLK